MSRSLAAAALSLAVVCASPASSADDHWSRPYAGVRMFRRHREGIHYHILMIDLRNPRLRIFGTSETDVVPEGNAERPRFRLSPTTEFARDSRASIAINANYFDLHFRKQSACGLVMSEGHVWTTTYVDRRLNCTDSIGFGAGGNAAIFDSTNIPQGPAPYPWMDTIVTGSPRILVDGQVIRAPHPRHAGNFHPRTALGLSRNSKTLYVFVANGREPDTEGMTTWQVGFAMRRLGAWNAINLDGGGSTALFVRREHRLLNKNGERLERPVSNHLGFAFDREPSLPKAVAEPPHREPPALAVESREINERPAPVVLPQPLRARRTTAVASALPIGRERWPHFAIGGVSSVLVAILAKVARRRRD